MNTRGLNTAILVLLICALINICNGQNDEPIKVNTVFMNVPIIAGDRAGRNVSGLKKEDFSVLQNGVELPIESFADAEAPVNVAILIDVSVSTGGVISDIKNAARQFVAVLKPNDRVMVVSFAEESYIRTEFTSDQAKITKAIKDARQSSRGGSNMYDPLYQILTEHLAAMKGRKAVIVLTDAEAGGERISYKKLLNTLVESDALVYPIFFQTSRLMPIGVKTITMNELLKIPHIALLNTIATSTGGRVYAAEGSNFGGAFQQIADELKKQYVIGFYPKDATEEQNLNNIVIKSNRPDVIIRSKRTFRLKTPNAKD